MATKKARRDYRTKDGVKLPGVTTVIGETLGWGKQALIGWAYKLGKEGRSLRERDDAADMGTIAHEVAGALLGGEAVDTERWTAEQIEKATPNGERVAAHILERYEVLHVELPIVGARCGGTLDYVLRARSDGALVLGDLKTGKGVYDEVAVQMGAYADLWEIADPAADFFARCAIFHAPYGETLAEVEISGDQLDAGSRVFAACLDIYEMRAACAMVKP